MPYVTVRAGCQLGSLLFDLAVFTEPFLLPFHLGEERLPGSWWNSAASLFFIRGILYQGIYRGMKAGQAVGQRGDRQCGEEDMGWHLWKMSSGWDRRGLLSWKGSWHPALLLVHPAGLTLHGAVLGAPGGL